MTRYLVTSALPYANGLIHFGHVVGAYLPADVYVRTLRMQGEDVRFICGTDEYGVAIAIGAEQQGIDYTSYVAHWREEIKSLFDRLAIEFDVWSGTSVCPYHEEMSLEFFRRLREGGYLLYLEGDQLYCPRDEMFLADRYVEGQCHECGFEAARGDECPRCGAWLDPLAIIEPRCKVCGTSPEKRHTGHWHLDLEKLRDERIGPWFRDGRWKPNVEAFVERLLDEVRARPITRDMRWGIPVPPEEIGGQEGKVLYVWFDAPIGYISFTREWAQQVGRPDAWKDYWQSPDTRLVHFIGKDNIPFHCLVFPSMLHGAKQDYVLPWQVPANEFYNLQGRKFNKGAGWTIPLEPFFESYDAETARFYLLASSPETADSEWRWEEFQRHANLLADKIGNLVTRVLRLTSRTFEDRIPPAHEAHVAELDQLILGGCGEVADPAESVCAFRFRRAAEQLLGNAEVANRFVDRTEPWALRKTDPERAASALRTACEWLAWMARWMAPFMPRKAQSLWAMLGQAGAVAEEPWPGIPEPGSWRCLETGQPLGEVAGLFAKIEDAAVQREIADLEARAAQG